MSNTTSQKVDRCLPAYSDLDGVDHEDADDHDDYDYDGDDDDKDRDCDDDEDVVVDYDICDCTNDVFGP